MDLPLLRVQMTMKDLRSLAYPTVAPSLLAADPTRLADEARRAEAAGAGYLHIDVMDGRFVPAKSFSVMHVAALRAVHSLVNDVHIMVEKPWEKAAEFARAGADIVTFHLEACPSEGEVRETIRRIHEAGANAGLSIKPSTPVCAVLPYLKTIDLLLLMSVEPGRGGQAFQPAALERMRALCDLLSSLPRQKRPILEIDGGINGETGPLARLAGAEALVAGSYLYGHADFADRLRRLL